jgi:hypothetical protein
LYISDATFLTTLVRPLDRLILGTSGVLEAIRRPSRTGVWARSEHSRVAANALTQDVFKDYLEHVKDHRLFEDRVFEQFAHVGKALANKHRLELLDLLPDWRAAGLPVEI